MLRHRLVAVAVPVALASLAGLAYGQLAAFPGAEGFGASATGGRHGDVYHVTKLTDYTGSPALSVRQGTFRHALTSANGPRTIVFDVGGTIPLLDELSVKSSNITIAGQTAPGPGITLVNYSFQVTSSSGDTVSDVIVRHIRSRKGDATTSEDAAGILGSGTTRNIIFDHVSASWGEDEVLSVSGNATNVTVQYSVMSEGLNAEDHGYAQLVRPRVDSKVSLHHNLYASSVSRNPRFGTYDAEKLEVDFRNNVVYNWGDRAAYAGGSSEPQREYVDLNFVGNYLVAGPSTSSSGASRGFTKDKNVDVAIHQSGNLIDADKDAQRDGVDTGWGMVYSVPNSTGTLTQRANAFAFAAVTTDTAADAYTKVLAGAGATPWGRDAVDARVFADVRNGTGAVIDAPNEAEWLAILSAQAVSRPAGWDTDLDGMPNAWELERGFNPSVMDHNLVQPDGYTALEHYLNGIVAVPEPGAAALLGVGAVGAVARGRIRR